MIEGLKVLNKWGPISGSPLVNVSRVGCTNISTFCKLFMHFAATIWHWSIRVVLALALPPSLLTLLLRFLSLLLVFEGCYLVLLLSSAGGGCGAGNDGRHLSPHGLGGRVDGVGQAQGVVQLAVAEAVVGHR